MQSSGPGGNPDPAPAWPIWSGSVPPLADGFTVRPDTVPDLETTLLPGVAVVLGPDRTGAPLLGTSVPDWQGPTGKTQLARYFAESVWRSPGVDVLTWIVASSRASVLSGFVQAAAAVGVSDVGDAEAVAARFVGWLGRTSRPWLLVFDDLRDAADLRGLWPAGPAGRLLITTANPAAVPAEYQALALPVPAFSTREAMTYLFGRLSTDPDQRSGAIDLAGDLGCEPLALAQAGAVIASAGMSCRDYRHYFTERQKQLAEAGRAEPSAAAVTWTFSAEYAEHLSPGVSIRSLVTLAALLDGRGIPGAVFTTPAVGQYLMSDVTASGAQDPQRTWNAILNLRRAGLIAVDPPGTPPAVRITPAIQAAIRAAVPKDLYERAVRAAADALLEVWPGDEPQSRLATDLVSCAISLRRHAGDMLLADGHCHPLLILAGQSMARARLTEPALDYWRELAADSERVLGPGHLETLMISGHFGEALIAAGQAPEAVPCLRRVLDGRASVLGPDHPAAIAANGSLASAYFAAGRMGSALQFYEEACAGYERTIGADHPTTLACQADLAQGYYATSRISDAIALLNDIIGRGERVLPPGDPLTQRMREMLVNINE